MINFRQPPKLKTKDIVYQIQNFYELTKILELYHNYKLITITKYTLNDILNELSDINNQWLLTNLKHVNNRLENDYDEIVLIKKDCEFLYRAACEYFDNKFLNEQGFNDGSF